MKLFSRENKAPKIFCVGYNKTGTTTLEKALQDLGYRMGVQREGEILFNDWVNRDFTKLEKLCNSADAFQDSPFSLHFTFMYLDQKFKGSKFILTVRDKPEDWYNSLVSFHGKLWANGGVPTKKDLMEAPYLEKGYAYRGMKQMFNTPDDDLYNKEILINSYNLHNEMVREYFRFRPSDLLDLNLSDKNSYQSFCAFLGKKPLYENFPWENKTADIPVQKKQK